MRLSSRALAGSGDSTWLMGKGIEFIGEVEEAWIPSSVFGSDTLAVDPKPILTFTLQNRYF
jgi:hypothetical protein